MSKNEYLYPMEVQVYQKIKWFTTKGELHCCCVSNDKLGELLGGRNKASISRTISKLIKLGYIEYKQKNPRQLISTSKEMIFNDYKVVINDDKTVINDDKVAIQNDKTVIENDETVIDDDKTVNLISLLNDETVIATMTKLLLSDDKTVNHKNIYKENIYKNIFKLLSTKKDNQKEKRFSKPTLNEIKDYCLERNNQVNPDKFFDYYTANGWKIGKNSMKDWKATIRTWEKNNYNNQDHKQEKIGGTLGAMIMLKEEHERREHEETTQNQDYTIIDYNDNQELPF